MTPEDLQKHKLDVIWQIEKHLTEIKNEKNPGFFFNMSDLLCRVGELESTVRWQFDLARDKSAEITKNRLCTCYDNGMNEE